MTRGYSIKLKVACAVVALGAIFILGAKETDGAEKARLALPIVKVNDKPVTINYMETITSKQNPALIKELADKEKLNEFIGKVVEMELLAAEAESMGYMENSDVAAALKNQLATIMHTEIADSVPDYEPTEEEMKKSYDEDPETYHKPEMTRARHILIKDQTKAQKLLKELIDTKVSQHDFRRKAQEESEDESTKTRGGDLTFFTKVDERRKDDPEIDPILVDAAFKLTKNGELHNKLLKTEKGHHILMRTGHRDKMDMSFDQARKRLSTLLKRDYKKAAIDAKIKEIESRFKIEIFEENLKHVVIDLSAGPADQAPKNGMFINKQQGKSLPVNRGPKKRP